MKQPALTGGSFMRRQLLKSGVAGMVAAACSSILNGCAGATHGSPATAAMIPGVLIPARNLTGAPLILRSSATGVPLPSAGFGPMTLLVSPVAVAASTYDTYIADAGANRLYRYDPLVEAMAVMPGVQVTPQTRLAIGPDNSVYVANQGSVLVRRYDRNGRLIQEISATIGAARYDDIAVDGATGTLYGLDRIFRQLQEVHPLGRAARFLTGDLLAGEPTAIAWDDHHLYLADQSCGCVVAIAPMRGTRMVVAQGFRQPSAIAVRDGWLVVLDNISRRLSVFYHGQLRGEAGFDSLQLVDPRGLALSSGYLYIADAAGHRVSVFRLGR